jgi:class 3 adenylate cyclase/pimeloyl-ACP methyl ester carboxylesterase
MAEREIRYCTAEDGVRVAYCVEGDGYPVLVPPWTWESITSRFDYEFVPRLFDPIRRGRMLLHWDSRGMGLSEHGQIPVTPEEFSLDARAVMQAVGVSRVGVFATILGGPFAICLAGVRPDSVSHLVLYDTWGSAVDAGFDAERVKVFAMLARMDWDMASKTMADGVMREAHPDLSLRAAQGFRAAMTGEEMANWIENAGSSSAAVWDVAGKVTADTLILHHLENLLTPFAAAQNMAAHIPNARLVPLPGVVRWSGLADLGPVHGAILPFLPSSLGAQPADEREQAAHSVAPTATATAGLAVILFVDIADSTALTERLGDAAFRAASRAFDERARAAIGESRGSVVPGKVLGDGVMAVFSSAAQALAAARRCIGLSAESELRLHIGLHAGDVIHDGDNVYGGAVNIAARICGESAPGETLVSATVRDLARTSAGARFKDRGERVLKGIEESQRLFAVEWD